VNDDLDYIARLEKAIKIKYGDTAIKNPRSDWDDNKEKEYLQQLKTLTTKQNKIQEKKDKVEVDGFFVSKKLLTRDAQRNCPVCERYSFKIKDDLYMAKYDCCHGCFVEYVEDREERWVAGWRPEKTQGED
jgi:Pyruvate/2-oxoacid:ferredoxin oxidoreductase delta subunit